MRSEWTTEDYTSRGHDIVRLVIAVYGQQVWFNNWDRVCKDIAVQEAGCWLSNEIDINRKRFNFWMQQECVQYSKWQASQETGPHTANERSSISVNLDMDGGNNNSVAPTVLSTKKEKKKAARQASKACKRRDTDIVVYQKAACSAHQFVSNA